MSICVLKLFDDYCLMGELPHWGLSIRKSSIDSINIFRECGQYFAKISFNGETASTYLKQVDDGIRLLSWHLGRPIPPPEILAIEDPVAYEAATAAWIKSSSEKTPVP